MEPVYHGSKTHGLTVLSPRKSTHGEEYVYATSSRAVALVISTHMTDLNSAINGSGTREDPLVVVERRPGVFEEYFKEPKSIYTLDGNNFTPRTSWGGEVVAREEHQY